MVFLKCEDGITREFMYIPEEVLFSLPYRCMGCMNDVHVPIGTRDIKEKNNVLRNHTCNMKYNNNSII